MITNQVSKLFALAAPIAFAAITAQACGALAAGEQRTVLDDNPVLFPTVDEVLYDRDMNTGIELPLDSWVHRGVLIVNTGNLASWFGQAVVPLQIGESTSALVNNTIYSIDMQPTGYRIRTVSRESEPISRYNMHSGRYTQTQVHQYTETLAEGLNQTGVFDFFVNLLNGVES